MIGRMSRLRTGIKRFGRPLIGVVVAYAVAAQSLLIVLGGFSLPAQADDGAPAFELCLHDAASKPRRNCRPAIPISPAAPIASSVLPDRIMR